MHISEKIFDINTIASLLSNDYIIVLDTTKPYHEQTSSTLGLVKHVKRFEMGIPLTQEFCVEDERGTIHVSQSTMNRLTAYVDIINDKDKMSKLTPLMQRKLHQTKLKTCILHASNVTKSAEVKEFAYLTM